VRATTFRFESCELDVARYTLSRDGEAVHVAPRVFDLLQHLLRNRARVVPKDELLDALWGSRFVSETALTTALRSVRAAIGDSGEEQRLIRTVHGRGYQFVGVVDAREDAGRVPGAGADPERQSIRFCTADDGTRIAWATTGSGPVLLKAANWLSHLDLEWRSPVWGHWVKGLAANRTVIRYDERGCGLSDWEVPNFGFDAWVSDLETVVDAAGLDTFPLLGVSQGGAVAIAYAARHPERVSKLILIGAYARGRGVRAKTEDERAAAAMDLELARLGWGHQDPSYLRVFASQFTPDGSSQDWDEFIDYQRSTAPPEKGARFLEEFARIDVSATAPQVRCPTLILHSRDDRRVPSSQASELATLIRDSRLVLLDSSNHLLGAAEPAWPELLACIDGFLAD
jgi:pimeloyl-ACP methyl ester carboxylesterase/DNA-binding winged helix-turn-helix (wHTH) protein